jgi:ABC-2 type transport system ATP-binding protein
MPSTVYSLECRAVTRRFGSRTSLDGVDLRARPGTVTALLGSNGAGKTTLMKILATLLLPTSGQATICGRDVVADPRGTRARMGFVPSEERSFHWRLTVRQNLDFFAALYGLPRKVAADRVDGHLAALHLLDRADTRFGELSTGMKQCLGIIRGLLHDPEVILLDEPTRSLSPDLARIVTQLLRDLAEREGRTILFATHNLQEAQSASHAVAILHRGRIQACGAPETLFQDLALEGPPTLEAIFHALTQTAGAQP